MCRVKEKVNEGITIIWNALCAVLIKAGMAVEVKD